MMKSFVRVAAVAAVVAAVWVASLAAQTLLNVSYDPTRELYAAVNAAFIKQWQAKMKPAIVSEKISILPLGVGSRCRGRVLAETAQPASGSGCVGSASSPAAQNSSNEGGVSPIDVNCRASPS